MGLRRVLTSLPLPRGRRLIVFAVALAVLAGGGTYAATALTGPDGRQVTAYFRAAVGLHSGSDVRILGVRVGTVDSITPQGRQVKVRFTVDHGIDVPAAAKAVVISPSVVSGRYLQLSPAYTGGPKLDDGAKISVRRTATPVEIDELYESLTDLTDALGPEGANKNGSFSELIDVGADNLKGNGKAIGDSIEQFGAATQTLSGSSDDLFTTIKNLSTFTAMLRKNDTKVRTAVRQLDDVTTFLDQNKQNLATALSELGGALGKVQKFIKDNRGSIKTNLDKLADLTGIVVAQRASLAEALDAAPLAADNVLRAYNPRTRTLDGRGNVNEISMNGDITIPDPGMSTAGLQPVTPKRAAELPPLPLPAVGEVYGTPEGGKKGGGR